MKHLHTRLAPLYYYIIFNSISVAIIIAVIELIVSPLKIQIPTITLMMTLGSFMAGLSCFLSLCLPLCQHKRRIGQAHALILWGPILLGLIFMCQTLVQIIEIFHSLAALPHYWADVVNLCVYPLLLFLLLLVPKRPTSRVLSFQIILDSVIILLALSSVIWYFLLGPLFIEVQVTFFLKLLGVFFPFTDLLLLCCFLLLVPHFSQRDMRVSRWMLLVGLTLLVVRDGIGEFANLRNMASPLIGTICVVGAYILLELSSFYMRFDKGMRFVQSERTDENIGAGAALSPLWASLLPYALLPVLIFLLFSAWRSGRSSLIEQGVYLGVGLVFGAILLRQVLALRQTRRYAQQVFDANARLAALATTDPLTELPNHRALATLLTQELARSQRYVHFCTVLFLDLDHFKALNDGYGHAAGDSVLRAFATLVRATIRTSDNVGRWGGEEFVVLLPETDTQGAVAIAERVREAVSMHAFELGGGMHLTCSIGVASYPEQAPGQEALLQAADQAMYGAKRLGRNQVRTIDDPAVQALLSESAEEGREETTLLGTVKALALLVERRDVQLGHHSQQVGEWALQLARALQIPAPEAHMLQLAGQLHDIGKISVPDALLRKSDSPTPGERKQIQSHCEVGAEVVSQIPSLRPLASVIRGHHERWDGQGYPDQLVGPHIPLGARILTVADAYTAILGKSGCSPAEAVHKVQQRAGTQFDVQIVQALALLVQEQQEKQAMHLVQ